MSLKNIEVFFDRCSVKSLPLQIENFIVKNQLTSSRENQRVSFCGVILLEGKKYIFFPRSSDINLIKYDVYNHAKILISALHRFFNHTKNKVFHPEDKFQLSDMVGLDQLEFRRQILADYLEHGLFFSKQDALKKNRGKIDWRVTLNKGSIFPDKNNSPIYLDYYSKNINQYDDEVTKIHVGVLQQIFEDNLFFDPKLKKIPYNIKHANASKLNVATKIKVLKTELKNQYNNQSIRLLRLLIDFLKNSYVTDSKSTIVGVTKFHYAWEHMLAETLSNTIDLNYLLPKPMYITKGAANTSTIKGGMRTDICVVDKVTNSVTIIDAKYYQASSIENAPGWGDLVKQFFYEKALKTLPKYSSYSIKNILIFPGTTHHFNKVRMVKILKPIPKLATFKFKVSSIDPKKITGSRSFLINSDYIQFQDKDFPEIDCKYVCPLKIMALYTNHQKIDLTYI